MLNVTNLRKVFADTVVIADLEFNLPGDRITCLLAPSGAGKTTLLRILAGLETATAGDVLVDDVPIRGPNPSAVLVPQIDTLFPHFRVQDQIAFGTTLWRNRKRLGNDVAQHIERVMQELDLAAFRTRFPSQLSGGQRQRVSLGRALAVQPKILLCDEPFSQLDEEARHDLRCVVRAIRRDFRQTILFVSHSPEETAFLGDEIWICDGPPLRIRERIVVPFGADRSDDLLLLPEFISFCHQVRDNRKRQSNPKNGAELS